MEDGYIRVDKYYHRVKCETLRSGNLRDDLRRICEEDARSAERRLADLDREVKYFESEFTRARSTLEYLDAHPDEVLVLRRFSDE